MTQEVLIPPWQGRASCPLHQTLPSILKLQHQDLNFGREARGQLLYSPTAVSSEPLAGSLTFPTPACPALPNSFLWL